MLIVAMTDPLLRRATPTGTPAIIDLHHVALRSVGADADPGDEDLNDVRQHYLEPGGEFLVLETNAQIIAMGALRRTGPQPARSSACAYTRTIGARGTDACC